ncbi:YceI family protein [Oerskovia sp. M15]
MRAPCRPCHRTLARSIRTARGSWPPGRRRAIAWTRCSAASGDRGRADRRGRGTLVVTDGELVRAEVTVATASIASDSVVRDDAFRRLLETDVFPDAVFILTEPVDLARIERRDEPLTVQARGTLTIRDVTEPVTVALEARRSGTGSGSAVRSRDVHRLRDQCPGAAVRDDRTVGHGRDAAPAGAGSDGAADAGAHVVLTAASRPRAGPSSLGRSTGPSVRG